MIIGKIDNEIIDKKVEIESSIKKIKLDPISKLSLLSTLAGYYKGKEIELQEYFKTNNLKLNSFINFLLNHEGFAPINYNINIKYNRDRKRKKIINQRIVKNKVFVLASGGIDSTGTILYFLSKGIKPILISLDFGQINNLREQKIIKMISKKLKLQLIIFKIDIAKEVINGWDEWSYIVPARNFLIASLGANTLNCYSKLGGIISMAATQEELRHSKPGPDKSQRFYSFCSSFFTKEYCKKIKLISPFKDRTKAEILSIWNKEWTKKFGISPYDTSTCYSGIECGKCNSCFKRSLALLAAGLKLDKNIKANPFKVDETKTLTYLQRLDEKNTCFTEERKLDTLIAFIKAKKLGYLPKKVINLLEKLKKKYSSKIKIRCEKLDVTIDL